MTSAFNDHGAKNKPATALDHASAPANLNDSLSGIIFYFCGRHGTPRQTAQTKLII
jgi:hypothetical protein